MSSDMPTTIAYPNLVNVCVQHSWAEWKIPGHKNGVYTKSRKLKIDKVHIYFGYFLNETCPISTMSGQQPLPFADYITFPYLWYFPLELIQGQLWTKFPMAKKHFNN